MARMTESFTATEEPAMTVQISTPGVNPSNRDAGFPNLAHHAPAAPDVIDAVTATCRAEMEAAGIKVHEFSFTQSNSEVPTRAFGSFGMWSFKRAWYYWTAKGPGIPVEIAEKLHAEHGTKVRVDGHCGCPSPREWYKGFGVGHYHVDSPEGLKALVEALRSVYDPDLEIKS